VREIVHDFYGSRYASCLTGMARLRPALLLDMHLHDHVDALYSAIRSRALVQYTAPFASVDLATMAEAFTTTVGCGALPRWAGLARALRALIVACAAWRAGGFSSVVL
jgi:COP9 signalosome complex subunit 1